jgi:hypothetical protein
MSEWTRRRVVCHWHCQSRHESRVESRESGDIYILIEYTIVAYVHNADSEHAPPRVHTLPLAAGTTCTLCSTTTSEERLTTGRHQPSHSSVIDCESRQSTVSCQRGCDAVAGLTAHSHTTHMPTSIVLGTHHTRPSPLTSTAIIPARSALITDTAWKAREARLSTERLHGHASCAFARACARRAAVRRLSVRRALALSNRPAHGVHCMSLVHHPGRGALATPLQDGAQNRMSRDPLPALLLNLLRTDTPPPRREAHWPLRAGERRPRAVPCATRARAHLGAPLSSRRSRRSRAPCRRPYPPCQRRTRPCRWGRRSRRPCSGRCSRRREPPRPSSSPRPPPPPSCGPS